MSAGLTIFALIMIVDGYFFYRMWKNNDKEARLCLDLINRYHAYQQRALNEYADAVRAYIAGDITLDEVDACYAHYLKLCGYDKEPER